MRTFYQIETHTEVNINFEKRIKDFVTFRYQAINCNSNGKILVHRFLVLSGIIFYLIPEPYVMRKPAF